MATRAYDDIDDDADELEVEDDVSSDDDEDTIDDDEDDASDDDDAQDDSLDEEVGFADDAALANAADLHKHLRAEIRKRDKELTSLRRAPQTPEPIVVGDKPTMESVDYDADKFEAEYEAWEDRKRQAARRDADHEEMQKRQAENWDAITARYAEKKAALRYSDVNEAERNAFDDLSPTTQAIIAKHAVNPALFIYAVGKSQAKRDELARIEAEGDPFAVAVAVARMEAQVTTKKTTRPPDPDTPVRGKPISAGGDKALKKLEEQGAKNGNDFSAMAAHKASREKK